jgi:hypothetical protein
MLPLVSSKKFQKKRERLPFSNLKKIFFGILSLRGNLRQAKVRESYVLIGT